MNDKLNKLIKEYVEGMKEIHIEETKGIIEGLIFHKDYSKYINVFDKDSQEPRSIIDIEETILLALKNGD